MDIYTRKSPSPTLCNPPPFSCTVVHSTYILPTPPAPPPPPRARPHVHQSMNLFVEAPDYGRLTSMHFYAWKKGLKTGMYYLRTRPAADAIPFTVDPASSSSRRGGGGDGGGEGGGDGGGGGATAAAIASLPKEREIYGEVCVSCQG